MNNKGFALIESVVLTTIIMLFLILSYNFITRIITMFEIRNKYNIAENVYKLNAIRTYIYTYGNINDIIENGANIRNYASLKNLNFNDNYTINNEYKNMLTDMNVKKVYFLYTKYEADGLSKIDNTAIYNISANDGQFKDYIEYTTNKYRYPYRIVAEFNDGEYSQVKLWSING